MRPELLAPAGSLSVCEAVIAAGADAVYLGGEKFSARAFAPNFSEQDILRALDLAHLYGRKIYLAINTLLKNREMDRELYRYIKPFYEHGLDAIIVQDYGVFQFVKRYFSELPVHISTQTSVANAYGAAFLRQKGAKRIILARELTLEEIRDIHAETDVELECFVHGALCYSYSGQCLMSSLIGGRSGNRGRCAQPCRLPYQVQDEKGAATDGELSFPLSLKDLCAIDLIPQLCEAGVSAFKIEGRMKSLEYSAGVTRIYREALERYADDPDGFSVSKKDRQTLLALGSRSGFCRGYYESGSGTDMLTRTDSAHQSRGARDAYVPAASQKIPVEGTIWLRPGQAMRLRVRQGEDSCVLVEGAVVQAAVNSPLEPGQVRTQLEKSGDTPFSFSALTVDMEGACFVPVSQINALRRQALDMLTGRLLAPHRRDSGAPSDLPADSPQGEETAQAQEQPSSPFLDVMVCTPEQLEAALACPDVGMISLDLDGTAWSNEELFRIRSARARIADAGISAGFCFPFVFRRQTSEKLKQREWTDLLCSFDALWVRSFDSLGYCLSQPAFDRAKIRLDAGLYVFSNEVWQDYALEKIGGYTASAELNAGELAHMCNTQAEFCVYGYTPAMISAQCVYKNTRGCEKDSGMADGLYLSDRFLNRFFIRKDCKDCCNVIYNSRPLSLLYRADEVAGLSFGSLRISFVTEGKEQAAAVLEDYRRSILCGEVLPAPAEEKSFTNGHFHRGVE